MSRCFPYPPPGYVNNCATGDALIESIKIKRDTERIKKEKKEQKSRDKENRKKEKKEKKEKKREKENLKAIQNIEGTNKRKRDGDGLEKSVGRSWVDSKKVEVHPPKKNETEAELLERSSLSEEHGQPVLAESLSYSSDGTQSRTKRIRIEQPPSIENRTPQGKSVRFRLKQKEPESAHPINDVPSTSGRTSTPITKLCDSLPFKDEPCFNVNIPMAVMDRKESSKTTVSVSDHGTGSVDKSQKKPKSAYEILFSNWIPPPIHLEAVATIDDETWMFPSKKQAGQNRLRLESLNGVSGLSSSAWPRAHLIPEADLYILPFTVPL